MQPTKPDLIVSDLTKQIPRKLVLNTADMSAGVLTLLEALDIVEASGIDSDEWAGVMKSGTLKMKAKLMYAFGWVVARRIEPDLTFEEVCTYQIEIVGKEVNSKAQTKRAQTVVAVASMAGVTPDEAEQLTLNEVAAVSELHRRRNVKRNAVVRKRAG